MRGLRLRVSGTWLWLVVMALLLAGLPVLQGRTGVALAQTALQAPQDERGGRDTTGEVTVAPLRRPQAGRLPSTPCPPPGAAALLAGTAWMAACAPRAMRTAEVVERPATPTARLAGRPGRRVQHGQAPPRA